MLPRVVGKRENPGILLDDCILPILLKEKDFFFDFYFITLLAANLSKIYSI
jgi:hypothetical protein